MLVGARNRVLPPESVGERSIISCTLGHVALVSAFVRVILEVRAGLHSTNGGVGEGVHSVCVEELVRVNDIFLFDTDAHNGFHPVDGEDPNRAVLPSGGGTVVEVAGEGGAGGSEEEEEDDYYEEEEEEEERD